jgi:hypothetical protein
MATFSNVDLKDSPDKDMSDQPVNPEPDKPTSKVCYREWSPLIKLLSQIPTRAECYKTLLSNLRKHWCNL